MKVILAQSAGFCRGVKRAVEKARTVARETDGHVYTDGPLIHNEHMMMELRKDSVTETDAPDRIGNAPLIVRAHGIPPSRRRMLKALPLRLIDATCPDVARIQGMVRKYARKGYDVVIFGDDGHAEVIGLKGFAEGRGFVVGTPAEVDKLPHLSPVCLVSQSTQFPAAFADIADRLKRRFPDVIVLDTICDSTRSRQQELHDLAGEVDAFVVVGSSHSANTLRLVALAGTLKPTFHIQTGEQIEPGQFSTFRAIGLTAGASTPQFIIAAVKRKLEAIPTPD